MTRSGERIHQREGAQTRLPRGAYAKPQMAKIGKRKTECLVEDSTVVLLKPYWDAGEVRFYENEVFAACGKTVAKEYLVAARVDFSGRRPQTVCRGCWLTIRERNRALMAKLLDKGDDDEGGGNILAPF